MSSAGHVLDMIKRMKANRALQKKNRNAFKRRKKHTLGLSYNSGESTLSEEEKAAIRAQLAETIAKDRRLLLIYRIIFGLAFLISLILFYIWFY
jgi:hypothetical protein